MTPRERLLAIGALTIIIVAGGGFLFYFLFLDPLSERTKTIHALELEVDNKLVRVSQIMADRPRLARYRMLSLPANADLAKRDYEKLLSELIQSSGFTAGNFSITPPKSIDVKSSPTITGKGPIYSKLAYNVQTKASLAKLVAFLERFYNTGVLHQLRTMVIQRPVTTAAGQQPTTDLDVTLNIEALIVAGAEKRNRVLQPFDPALGGAEVILGMRGGPLGLPLAIWAAGPTGVVGPRKLAQPARSYAAIAKKNIFFGPEILAVAETDDIEVARFVYLTDITQSEKRHEAFLYDRLSNRRTRLRTEPGFDSFRIQDAEGETLIRGKVVRIDPRDVFFRVDEKWYQIHLGQNLEASLKMPLSRASLERLGLVAPERTVQK